MEFGHRLGVLILGLSIEDPKLLGQSANLPLRGSQGRVLLRVPWLGRVESRPTCSPAHDLALASFCTEEPGTCQLAYGATSRPPVLTLVEMTPAAVG